MVRGNIHTAQGPWAVCKTTEEIPCNHGLTNLLAGVCSTLCCIVITTVYITVFCTRNILCQHQQYYTAVEVTA